MAKNIYIYKRKVNCTNTPYIQRCPPKNIRTNPLPDKPSKGERPTRHQKAPATEKEKHKHQTKATRRQRIRHRPSTCRKRRTKKRNPGSQARKEEPKDPHPTLKPPKKATTTKPYRFQYRTGCASHS